MSVSKEAITEALEALTLPDGGNVVSRDLVRALTVSATGEVSFVLEAPDAAGCQRKFAGR